MRRNKINKTAGYAENQLSVGLLGASFGTNNFGVAALACGTVSAICRSNPNARLFLVDYAREPASYSVFHSRGSAKVELINIRFSKRFYTRNNIARLVATAFCFRFLLSRKWQIRFIKQNRILKIIHEANIIGSIAGGDSFSDIYGINRLIYVALPQLLVLLMDKPLVLLPQTIGPFRSSIGRAVARYIIKRAQKVYSRDKEGLDKMREIVPAARERMAFCYDMGFVLEPRIAHKRIPNRLAILDRSVPLVGFNVSGLLYMGGYTKKNMFGLKVDYRRLIFDLIEFLVNKYNAHLILVPHVTGSVDNSESDTVACQKVFNESENRLKERLQVISQEYDQHELKALIGRCDFFIGSRMHACIAALSQCVPAVGLAYSRKFRGVFESIGVEELVLDLRKHDHKYILETLDQAYEQREYFRAQLQKKMPSVRASILGLFAKIGAECTTDMNVQLAKV